MIKLLTATDTIEAHLILNMLKQVEIEARIDGELLQGGIGELQSFGSLRIMVREEQFPEAKAILDDYFNAPLADEESFLAGQVNT